jgi:hypothetical protein
MARANCIFEKEFRSVNCNLRETLSCWQCYSRVDAKEVFFDRSRLLVRRPLFSLLKNGKNKSAIIVKFRLPFRPISIVKCFAKIYSAATPLLLRRPARKYPKLFADFINSYDKLSSHT